MVGTQNLAFHVAQAPSRPPPPTPALELPEPPLGKYPSRRRRPSCFGPMAFEARDVCLCGGPEVGQVGEVQCDVTRAATSRPSPCNQRVTHDTHAELDLVGLEDVARRTGPAPPPEHCRCCFASCIISPPGAGSPLWWRASLLLVQPAVRVQSSTSTTSSLSTSYCIASDSSRARQGESGRLLGRYVCPRTCEPCVCVYVRARACVRVCPLARCPGSCHEVSHRDRNVPCTTYCAAHLPVVDSSCSPSQMHLSQRPLRDAALSSSSAVQSSLVYTTRPPPLPSISPVDSPRHVLLVSTHPSDTCRPPNTRAHHREQPFA